ncbi:hypothetical protein RMCBS344292_03720 [Rhizopus microsporus]|nr:hypothetical protein RMCBS344292_03720 [Rhizopus microsporus]
MTQLGKPTTIFDLSLDTKLAIINYLDNRSLANFSKTCSYFAMLTRSVLAYRIAYVDTVNRPMSALPPFINFRAGVAIGTTFYMPFMSESLLCYTFDLLAHEWSSHKLTPIDHDEIHPQVTSAAAIGHKIYLVGGRLLKSYTLSNSLIEIDTRTFTIRIVKDAQGSPPRPRHEHSVDTVDNRYLIVFGGLCYNSVGENDVFVYDSLKNTWFVPPISGQIPHLRFGHASAVIGKDFYVHGGAQIDSDSSYIIYDDLYKLDCNTWVWYKYEHPEVERYFRHQPERGTTLQKEHLIPTTGDSPHDRFQAYMCAASGKLIIFGGHSIRVDEDDDEILCNYPLNELSIFNTRRQSWVTVHAQLVEPQNEASLTVSNMCVAVLPIDSRGARLFVFASKKLDEYGKVTNQLEAAKKAPSESSFSSSDRISSGSLSRSILHDIAETTAQEELPEGRTWQQENSKHVEVSKDLKLRVYVFTLSLECYGPIRKTRGYPIRR